MASKAKVKNGSKVTTPPPPPQKKATSTPPKGCVWQYEKQPSKHFPKNGTYRLPSIKVNNVHKKTKVKNLVKGHNPQTAHLHPMRNVCMQYENNPVKCL